MALEGGIEYDNDWTERFIHAIQSRPAIYDKRQKEHSDRNIISRLWSEVCETVVDGWSEMTPQDKNSKGKEIQQRWRNLRTCFRRELSNQRKSKSGQAAIKRRKYVYFDELLFLLPTLEDRETISEINIPQTDDEDGFDNKDDELHQTSPTQLQRSPPPQSNPSTTQTAKKPKKLSYEDSLLDILKEKKNEQIDEDKSFLLSLVPSFKKLTDDQKMEAKMEFLSTMRRFTRQASGPSTTAIPTYQFFQRPHNFNQSFPQNVDYYLPQNSSLQRQTPLSNMAMPLRSNTPISTDNSQNSWMSSKPTSPESDIYDLS